jgi:hypothetical protein
VDPEFEMLVVACTINLLEGLMKSKFKNSSDMDLEYLKMENLSLRKRTAILHRASQK